MMTQPEYRALLVAERILRKLRDRAGLTADPNTLGQRLSAVCDMIDSIASDVEEGINPPDTSTTSELQARRIVNLLITGKV
jgi:hypothetical protein